MTDRLKGHTHKAAVAGLPSAADLDAVAAEQSAKGK